MGVLTQKESDYTAAQGYYENALEIGKLLAEETQSADDRRNVVLVYEKLGELAQRQGDYLSAQRDYEESLALGRKLMHETETLQSQIALAHVCFVAGVFHLKCTHDLDKARALMQETAALGKGRDDAALKKLGRWAEEIIEQQM